LPSTNLDSTTSASDLQIGHIARRGLTEATRWRYARSFIGALILYPVIFLPFGIGVLAPYYAGCGDKHLAHYFYDFSSAKSCISNVTGLIHNLSVFGDPDWSLALFIVGWALTLIGTVLFACLWRPTSPSGPSQT
jgi:hypothetical protein